MSKKSIVGHMGCFGGDNSQALLHLEKAQKGKNNPYSQKLTQMCSQIERFPTGIQCTQKLQFRKA